MEQSRKIALRRMLLAVDAVAIMASMAAAFLFHAALRQFLPFLKATPHFRDYALLAYLTLPLWLALIVALGLHRCFERPWTPGGLLVDLLKLHAIGLIGLSLILFLTQSVINRAIVALFLISTLTLLWLARIIVGLRLAHPSGRGYGQLRLLLVGDSVGDIAGFVRAAAGDPLPPVIVGRVSEDTSADSTGGIDLEGLPPLLGSAEDLERILHDEAVDQVLFFPPWEHPEMVPEAMRLLRSLGVAASFAILRRGFGAPPRLFSFYGHAFVGCEASSRAAEALAIKHALDFVIAVIALVAFLPVLILTSAAILLTMGRPVLFIQERAGLYGRRFRMLKFRTMERGAEQKREELLTRNEMKGPVFKITDDPRITRLGKWLRRTSIDELPQLVNVLVGSMSLVGPRPLPIEEQQSIRGWHRRRLSMKPGITGLWQVSGRSEVDFEEWIRMDLKYIDEWSPRLDARILLRTIPAVLLARGSR